MKQLVFPKLSNWVLCNLIPPQPYSSVKVHHWGIMRRVVLLKKIHLAQTVVRKQCSCSFPRSPPPADTALYSSSPTPWWLYPRRPSPLRGVCGPSPPWRVDPGPWNGSSSSWRSTWGGGRGTRRELLLVQPRRFIRHERVLTARWSSWTVSSEFFLVGGTAEAHSLGSLQTELHLDRRGKCTLEYSWQIPTREMNVLLWCQLSKKYCLVYVSFIVPIFALLITVVIATCCHFILFLGLFRGECLPNVAISNSSIPKDQLEGYKIKKESH